MRLLASSMSMLVLGGCGHFFEPSTRHLAALAEQKRIAQSANETGDKICKRMMVTGSSMPKRVCSTAEEWATFEEKNIEASEDFQRESRKSGIPTAGEGN